MGRTSRGGLGRAGGVLGLFMAAALSAPAGGCHHNGGESLVVTGDGSRLPAEAIDQDPLSLLPSNPAALVWVDATAFFASPFGNELARLVATRIPLTGEAGFEPKRDLKRIIGGAYSLAGADFVAVVQGDFRPDLIRQAAEKHAGAMPVTRSQYAGNDVYTTNNVGFTVVTAHTLLVGNETGMRRALDSIRDNRLKRDLPDWMTGLVTQPNAAMVVAGDVAGQALVGAAARRAPFLQGLSSFRVLGNFRDPGLNWAGALSYPDAATAAGAAAALRSFAQSATIVNVLSVLGLGTPLRTLQVEPRDSDVQFVMALDAQGISRLLSML